MGFNVSSIYGVNPITDRRRKPRLISNTITQATVQPSLIGLPPQHPPNIPYGTGQMINSIFGSGTARQVVPQLGINSLSNLGGSILNGIFGQPFDVYSPDQRKILSMLYSANQYMQNPQPQSQSQGLVGLPPQPINAGALNFNPFMIGR